MMLEFWGLKDEIRNLRDEIVELRMEKKVVSQASGLTAEIVGLKTEISDLKIDKSRLQEAHEKEDRELRHMIGLEKKRQEFEIGSAKKEAVLSVREENLAVDRKRFEEQLKFHEDRFTKEVGYLKEMIDAVLKRLPSINVEMGGKKR